MSTKPPIRSFGFHPPLTVQPYERYLPTAFDESLSLLEKVNKLVEYANSIGQISDGVVNQWNAVSEWILNEGLDESTRGKLNEMIESGEFDTIINEELLNSKSSVIVSENEPENSDSSTIWYEVKNTPTAIGNNIFFKEV